MFFKAEENEAWVFYGGRSADYGLDEELRKVFEKYKYKDVGSGYNMVDRVRDLQFEKGEKNE